MDRFQFAIDTLGPVPRLRPRIHQLPQHKRDLSIRSWVRTHGDGRVEIRDWSRPY